MTLQDVATTNITTEKVLRLNDESMNTLLQAFHILDQIPEEWNDEFPEFEQAYTALKIITSYEEFRIEITDFI